MVINEYNPPIVDQSRPPEIFLLLGQTLPLMLNNQLLFIVFTAALMIVYNGDYNSYKISFILTKSFRHCSEMLTNAPPNWHRVFSYAAL